MSSAGQNSARLSKAKHPGLTVLWSADAGSQTRELRITRGAATVSVMLMSAVIGACMWVGWELGHWSAKDTSLAQSAITPALAIEATVVAEQVVAEQVVAEQVVAEQTARAVEQDVAR